MQPVSIINSIYTYVTQTCKLIYVPTNTTYTPLCVIIYAYIAQERDIVKTVEWFHAEIAE